MRAPDVTATLAAFEHRGPGTDAERRAARRLARDLNAEGFRVTTEPFWCRPNWALAHAWHVALALAGSLVSLSHPAIGAALLATALLSVIADGLTGVSPGRRLTPERASQNLVSRPSAASDGAHPPTRLIVTAKYDIPRAGLIYRDGLRRIAAALRRLAGPLALGWLAWLSIAIAWSLAVAIIRATGHDSKHIFGVIQLPPTVALVLALALLLEAAAAGYRPGASDHGASAAVAIAATSAIAASPPRNVAVELVLQGAGEGQESGMRGYLKAHRRELRDRTTIVLGIAASGGGSPRWWRSDGRLIPIRYTGRLNQLAETAAEGEASPWRGRGGTPALPARARRLPAIAIGNVDTAYQGDENTLDRLQEFALRFVTEIDSALEPGRTADEQAPTPA
jgi:hypothetical protein